MARTEAQKEWRRENKRREIRIELTEDASARWDAYAERLNMPTGRMVRMCVERCIAEDGMQEDTTTVEPDVTPDQPASSDVQNGREMIL